MLCIGIILAFAPALSAQPADLARRVAQREAEAAAERANYMYRQEVILEEVDSRGMYKELREVIFSPSGERSEKTIGAPTDNLKRLRLTKEDFEDIREVQPFLFTPELLWLYQTKIAGEQNIDGVDCWLLQVTPKQTFEGQRMFDGIFWVDKADFSVVRAEGVAVPQLMRYKNENLFPRFTTFREKVDGKFRFPIHTFADDTLAFSSGPLRIRMTIRYSNYKRFGARSTITFEDPKE